MLCQYVSNTWGTLQYSSTRSTDTMYVSSSAAQRIKLFSVVVTYTFSNLQLTGLLKVIGDVVKLVLNCCISMIKNQSSGLPVENKWPRSQPDPTREYSCLEWWRERWRTPHRIRLPQWSLLATYNTQSNFEDFVNWQHGQWAMSTVLIHLPSLCFSLRKIVCYLCGTSAFNILGTASTTSLTDYLAEHQTPGEGAWI